MDACGPRESWLFLPWTAQGNLGLSAFLNEIAGNVIFPKGHI